jgi:hypothetical protein
LAGAVIVTTGRTLTVGGRASGVSCLLVVSVLQALDANSMTRSQRKRLISLCTNAIQRLPLIGIVSPKDTLVQ